MRLETQIVIFLVVFLLGVTVGLAFDIQRVWRSTMRPKRWAQNLMDGLFLLLTGGVVILGVLLLNWGEPRFYVFFGLILGFLAYRWLASQVIFSVLVYLFNLTLRLVITVWNLVLRMVAVVTTPIAVPLRVIIKRARRPLNRLKRVAKSGVRRVYIMWKKLPGFLA